MIDAELAPALDLVRGHLVSLGKERAADQVAAALQANASGSREDLNDALIPLFIQADDSLSALAPADRRVADAIDYLFLYSLTLNQGLARAVPGRVVIPGSRRLPALLFPVIALILLVLTGQASNLYASYKHREAIYARDIPNIRAQFTRIIDGEYLTDAGIEKMTTYRHDLWIPFYFTFEYTFYPGGKYRGAESLWGEHGRIISFFGIFEKTIEWSRWIK